MYKVVLIDDEDIILDGLKKVVEWEKYGCVVAATASNAEESAAVIREVKPDIIITDIKMPDQDGISLLAGLRSEFPDILVTVLTGYRNFDYAQKAIRLGVSRFLLKPSRMDEIHEALSFMTNALEGSGTATAAAGIPGATGGTEEENAEVASFVVRHAEKYIREHYSEKLTLSDVADKCYVSKWHLSKLLHRYLDKSFYNIINEIRIAKAKELLADPSLTITDICEIVGYNDPTHFSKVFKRIAGISANEYRNG
jgi:two-component system response regulator YesN